MIITAENTVINWHLLEPCQFKCKYCYAEWGHATLSLVYKSTHDSSRLIKQIASLKNRHRKVRLSFAGGEPFLDNNLTEKIDCARQHGLTVSIITNGDLLSEEFIRTNAGKIYMLGISIDSLDAGTNLQIGRATIRGKLADHRKIIGLLSLARQLNPRLRVKINTVVNRFNYDQDLSLLIDRVKPYKWKVMRVLPATPKSAAQAISDAQYAAFRERHAHIECALFEDNECMQNSYLMIDPYGRFFFNRQDAKYGYSDPILAVGIDKALAQNDFDATKFSNRYPQGVE